MLHILEVSEVYSLIKIKRTVEIAMSFCFGIFFFNKYKNSSSLCLNTVNFNKYTKRYSGQVMEKKI